MFLHLKAFSNNCNIQEGAASIRFFGPLVVGRISYCRITCNISLELK